MPERRSDPGGGGAPAWPEGPEAELDARFRARRVRVTRRGRVVMAGVAFTLGVALCAPVAWWAGHAAGSGTGAEAVADAGGSGVARSALPSLPDELEVSVAGDEGWQDTGLFLRAQDAIRLRAVSGSWQLPGPRAGIGREGPDPGAPTPMVALQVDPALRAPDEASAQEETGVVAMVARGPLPGAPYGALIARVGEGPPMLATGRIEAQEAGRLYLRANVGDDRLGEAGGAVVVRIAVEAGEDGANGTG